MCPERRPVETEVDIPALAIVCFPDQMFPLSITVPADWFMTGEVEINAATEESMEAACRLIDYARNALADELLRRQKRSVDPPF